MHWWRILTALLLGIAFSRLAVADEIQEREFFESFIRPLLAEKCYACHTASRLGGLQLDSRETILKGGNSGTAVIPGEPDRSLLIQAVDHTHERLRMPPQGKLKDSEIVSLTAWVKGGAYWPPSDDPAQRTSATKGYVISPEQRAFWAFQPIRKPALPKVHNRAWIKSPLDSFVLAQLESRNLRPVRPADKRAWIRRATFDLTGLPPTPEEIAGFLKDPSAKAYARVVDRLLASPRYGERWGRHWLDVARYSDDKLAPEEEKPYPNAFRYRDWVIQAFNDDMPYDLFVKAQIAGDLVEGQDTKKLVAGLGFYALRPEFQDDRVDATTRGFLGLTVACAQCHDHKYDPIPTKDYYSLLGVFTSTEEHEFPLAPDEVVKQFDAHQKRIEEQESTIKEFIAAQNSQLGQILATKTAKYLLASAKLASIKSGDEGQRLTGLAEQERLDRQTLERWFKYLRVAPKEHPYLRGWEELTAHGASELELKQEAQRFQALALSVFAERKLIDEKNLIRLGGKTDRSSLSQGDLLSLERDKYFLWRDLYAEKTNKSDSGLLYFGDKEIDRFLFGEWQSHLNALRVDLAELKRTLPQPYPFLQVIKDNAKPANERIHLRGSAENLGEEAPRRFLSILSDAEPAPFQRGSGRLELAEAIANPRNPLFARVMVNRIWQHHFGQGIVRTPSNFGRLGDRPSHPELLDYLASRFIENRFSIKALHREIMLSATYALGSAYSAGNFAADPENRLLWRFNRKRLDVEALRDALLFVSGKLDSQAGRPPMRLTDENCRRTVYGYVSRKKLDGFLALFDFPNPNNTSEQRIETHVPLQQLFFLNSRFIILQAKALTQRLKTESVDDVTLLHKAYLALFGREATPEEIRLGLEFLRNNSNSNAWPDYVQALLSSNEFVYVN